MPIYSIYTPLPPGHLEFPFCPCYGYDADGVDIGAAKAVDTDTGLVERCTYDAQGQMICDGYGHPEIPGAKEGEQPTEVVQFMPPITFEREKRTTWRDRAPLL